MRQRSGPNGGRGTRGKQTPNNGRVQAGDQVPLARLKAGNLHPQTMWALLKETPKIGRVQVGKPAPQVRLRFLRNARHQLHAKAYQPSCKSLHVLLLIQSTLARAVAAARAVVAQTMAAAASRLQFQRTCCPPLQRSPAVAAGVAVAAVMETTLVAATSLLLPAP